eukprot:359365-Chlamydomonas_euryale.AAC.9
MQALNRGAIEPSRVRSLELPAVFLIRVHAVVPMSQHLLCNMTWGAAARLCVAAAAGCDPSGTRQASM